MPAGRHTPAATAPKPTGCLHQFADPNPALWDLPARTPTPPPAPEMPGWGGSQSPREPEEENPSPTAPALNHIRTRELRPDPRGTVRACQGLPPPHPREVGDLGSHPLPTPRAPRRIHSPRASRVTLHRAGKENLGAGPGWTELVPSVPSGCHRDRTGWRKRSERRGHSRGSASSPDSDSSPSRTKAAKPAILAAVARVAE